MFLAPDERANSVKPLKTYSSLHTKEVVYQANDLERCWYILVCIKIPNWIE